MKYDACTDEELIERLRQGETEITDYILEKYKPLVRKYANAMYLIGGETDDLIQEGMIGLFKAIRDFCLDKDSSFFHFAGLCIHRQLYSAIEASNRKKHQPLNSYLSFFEQGAEGSIGFTSSPEQLVIEQEVRGVSMAEQRVAEAAKLGFEVCILPKVSLPSVGKKYAMKLIGVANVREALDAIQV